MTDIALLWFAKFNALVRQGRNYMTPEMTLRVIGASKCK